jgi:DNA-directed RNA polymerase alpha subunit
MKKWTLEEALAAADKLGIDFSKVKYTQEEFLVGMNIELEHGLVNPVTNVTDNDPLTTAKIAKAHLNEFPEYYHKDIGLKAWEHAVESFEGDPNGKKLQIV